MGRFFGEISYSLYLLHWLVGSVALSVASDRLFDTPGDSGQLPAFFFALAVCVVASFAFYATVEKPSRRLSSRLRYGEAQAAGRERDAPIKVDAGKARGYGCIRPTSYRIPINNHVRLSVAGRLDLRRLVEGDAPQPRTLD